MEKNMLNIVNNMKDELLSKSSILDTSQKTALKAYNICISLLGQAAKMVNMKFSGQSYDEKYYSVRESRVFNNSNNSYFIDKKDWFDKESNQDSKESFLVYAHAVQMVRTTFYDKKKNELKKAKDNKQIENIFECQMAVDILSDLLESWQKMWESGDNYNK